MKRIFMLFALVTMALVIESVFTNDKSVAVAVNEEIEFLGEGVASYTIDPGKNFIVKRHGPLRFDTEPGPTYEANQWERVWSTTGSAPPVLYKQWINFGHVPADCTIEYQVIDDDVDDRINTFYISFQTHSIEQGMVTKGEFTTEYSGTLHFHAADSIGMWIDICDIGPPTLTPTPTDEPTFTPTATEEPPTFTPTATVEPTFTPTATEEPPTFTPTATNIPSTLTPTATDAPPTLTPTATDVPPTLTPTATDLPPTATEVPPTPPLRFTLTPTATDSPPTLTPTGTTPPDPVETPTGTSTSVPPGIETPSPTPTKKPRLPSCTRINFEVSGHFARAGAYEVKEIGGRLLTTWYAEEGWTDSGWIQPIDITFENVFVQVIYNNPGGSPITMEIMNPAPNTPYGWMSRGMCHAQEVAWPDTHPPFGQPAPTPVIANPPNGSEPVAPTATPLFVPGQDEPTPEPTSSGSLRG